MNRIYTLSGVSGAGKDTLAKALMELDNDVVQVQWSGIFKRTFENWYGIPEFSLDDRVFRLTEVPGLGKTYLQVMIDAYHKWNEIDPRLTIRPTIRRIVELLNEGKDIVITDTRKKEEAEDLYYLVMYGDIENKRVIDLFNVHIFGRKGEAALESDDNLDRNLTTLSCCSSSDLTFINNGGIDKVETFASELLNRGYWWND